MDYMSGELRGGLGEMMAATTDSVLARQLPVQKCRVWAICILVPLSFPGSVLLTEFLHASYKVWNL